MKRWTIFGAMVALLLFPVSCRKSQQPAAGSGTKPATATAKQEQNLANADKKLLLPLGNLKFLETVALQHPGAPGQLLPTNEFKENEPITVTVQLKQVPPGLAVTAVFLDSNESEMVRDRKVLNPSQKSVAFEVPDTRTWRPGRYHVQIWVGGDKESDLNFEIQSAKKKKK